jgi:hypothetical protein
VKYALLIYSKAAAGDFEGRTEDQQRAVVEEYLELERSPEVLAAQALQPVQSATTVRVANGEALLSDGPFIEAKEHLGGFFLVEADNLDQATAIAARIPAARMGGAIEVRPIAEH